MVLTNQISFSEVIIRGYESIWFLGDDFANQTIKQYYIDHQDNYKGYARDLFEVHCFTGGPENTNGDSSTISRIRNALVHGINKVGLLPKLVAIVPDDDIINFLNYSEEGISKSLGRVLDWIMREHNRITESYKEMLPLRAKRANYPQFIWIQAPTHDNFTNNLMRLKFNNAISSSVQFNENTWSLQLKKVWDSHCHSLYNKEDQKFTIDGIKSYWDAVDKTLHFADTILLKNPKEQENLPSQLQQTATSVLPHTQ